MSSGTGGAADAGIPLPAGIRIEQVETIEAADAAARVLDEVWGEQRAFSGHLLRALAHAGEYVVCVWDADRLVGASMGFCGPPSSRTLHSHVTGLVPEVRARGLGRAIKHHQRRWALERGIERITWTFDPLVARNAAFNLRVLGARPLEYLVNHYGALHDEINRGDESDRLLVAWDLGAVAPAPPTDDRVRTVVPVPPDIESLRAHSPADALAWRMRVRDALGAAMAAGLAIEGFDARGYLLVER